MKNAKESKIKIGKKTFYGPFFHGTSYAGLISILKTSSLKFIDNSESEYEEEDDESMPVIYASVQKDDADTFSRGTVIQLKNYSVSPSVIIAFYTAQKPDRFSFGNKWAEWLKDEVEIMILEFEIIEKYHNKEFEDLNATKRLRLLDHSTLWEKFLKNKV